jgi:hypothetical protein
MTVQNIYYAAFLSSKNIMLRTENTITNIRPHPLKCNLLHVFMSYLWNLIYYAETHPPYSNTNHVS